MKEKKSGCSSSVQSTKESDIFQGHKRLLGTVLGAETVLNICSHALPCGSTPPVVQHRAAAASSLKPANSGILLKEGFFDYSSYHGPHAVQHRAAAFCSSRIACSGSMLKKEFSTSDVATGALNASGRQVVRMLDSKCHSDSIHLCLLVPWSILHPVVVVVHVGRVVGLHCVVLVVDRTLWEGLATLVENVCCWHMEVIHGIRVWYTVRDKVQSVKNGKTSLSPLSFFLVSSHSLNFFGGCLVWHLWLGRARHPGAGSVGIEVLSVGGWLTNGDSAAEASVDFLCVTEHRLVSARARSEWKRLRNKSVSSIWSPASQE